MYVAVAMNLILRKVKTLNDLTFKPCHEKSNCSICTRMTYGLHASHYVLCITCYEWALNVVKYNESYNQVYEVLLYMLN